jgi:putative selenate reductase
VCTDLLKPGGYGRLQSYANELAMRMKKVGAASVEAFTLLAYGQAEAALDRLGLPHDGPVRQRCLETLAEGGDLKAAAGSDFERWVSEATLLNTEHYVSRVVADPRFSKARNERPPRKIGRRLKLFDCISCDKCVPVCPNDANFTFRLKAREIPVIKVRRLDSSWSLTREGVLNLTEDHQIGTFADFCNECGNCDVFCPEDGGPYLIKPRFFGSEQAWRSAGVLEGVFIERKDDYDLVLGRFESREFRLERRGEWFHFSGEGFHVRFCGGSLESTLDGETKGEIDLTWCHIMDRLREGVLETRNVNYLNVMAGTPERPGD